MKKFLFIILFFSFLFSIGCSIKPKNPYPSTGVLYPLRFENHWDYMSYNENSSAVSYSRKEIRDTMTVLDTVHLYKLYIGEANSDFSSINWNSSEYLAKNDSFLYYYNFNDSFPHWKDMPNEIKIGDSWISNWDLQEYIVLDKDSVTVPAGSFFAYKIRVYPDYENHALSYYEWIAEGVGIVKEQHDTWSTVLMDYKIN